MAGLVGVEGTDQRVAEQVQIADCVQYLVFHELVFVAQSVIVEDAIVVEHDGVIQPAAARQAYIAQRFQIAHKAEGAGAADFLHEGSGRKIHAGALSGILEGGVVEIDGEGNLETLERLEAGPFVAVFDPNFLLDPNEALGCRLFGDAGRLDQKHERAGAAVHDRHFGGGQVDVGVIDSQPRERRHQMLHGRDAHALTHERGRQARVGHVLRTGTNLDGLGEIDAAENDARVDRRRAQGEINLLARVQPDSRGTDDVFEGTLFDHLLLAVCRFCRSHRLCEPPLWQHHSGDSKPRLLP